MLLVTLIAAVGFLLLIGGVHAATSIRALVFDSPLPNPIEPQAYLPLIYRTCCHYWSTSRYMSTVDYSALWTLGCNTGLITPDGEDIVVILDFGPPWFDGVSTYGTRLFNTHEYVSISRIYTATQGFLSGFYNCTYTKPYVHLTVAIGTNNNPNFGGLSADHGIRWARMINDLNDWIDRVPYYSLKLTARGANDIELAFALPGKLGSGLKVTSSRTKFPRITTTLARAKVAQRPALSVRICPMIGIVMTSITCPMGRLLPGQYQRYI